MFVSRHYAQGDRTGDKRWAQGRGQQYHGYSRGQRWVFSKRIAAICSEMRAKRKTNTLVISKNSAPLGMRCVGSSTKLPTPYPAPRAKNSSASGKNTFI